MRHKKCHNRWNDGIKSKYFIVTLSLLDIYGIILWCFTFGNTNIIMLRFSFFWPFLDKWLWILCCCCNFPTKVKHMRKRWYSLRNSSGNCKRVVESERNDLSRGNCPIIHFSPTHCLPLIEWLALSWRHEEDHSMHIDDQSTMVGNSSVGLLCHLAGGWTQKNLQDCK